MPAAKFLDANGLQYFWSKVTGYVDDSIVSISADYVDIPPILFQTGTSVSGSGGSPVIATYNDEKGVETSFDIDLESITSTPLNNGTLTSGTPVPFLSFSAPLTRDVEHGTGTLSKISINGIVTLHYPNESNIILYPEHEWPFVVNEIPAAGESTEGILDSFYNENYYDPRISDNSFGDDSILTGSLEASGFNLGVFKIVLSRTSQTEYQISLLWIAANDTGLYGSNIRLTATKRDGSTSTIAIPTADFASKDVYAGATASANGTAGLVPAALIAERDKFLKGDGTWAEVSTEKEVGYSTTEPTSQSTASLDNESFVFYETESFGGDGAWNASISGNAATADSVNHAMTLTIDGGTLEGLTKYSFNGSVAKEVNLAAGNGVTLTPTYGTVTISTETYPTYQGATENANGVEGLVPAATSAEKDKYLKGDGTWEQVLSGIQNISVQEINVAKGKNAHSVDPTEWMYYNDYSTIDADVQFLDAENQLVAKTFNANSDGITFAFPEGSEPKTLSGKVELCKGNCDYWDEIAFDGISIEDLLAAGENGIFVQDAFTKNETASAYPYQDDTNAIVCMIDNGNGSYTLKLATCETEEVAEPSLQVEKADGTTESVNMDALYSHIGGSIQVETSSVSVSNIEELPLTAYLPGHDDVEPSQYPAYSIADMLMSNGYVFLNESGGATEPSNYTITGNVAELQFRLDGDIHSNGLPKTFCPTVYCLTEDNASPSTTTSFVIGIDNNSPSSISIEDALASVNGIELIGYRLPEVESGSEINVQPIPTEEDPIYLFVEKISDDPYTLRLKLAKKETSTETTVDSVLHLEKSKSSNIDLSPVYEHIGGRVEFKSFKLDLESILPAISGDDWPPSEYPVYDMYFMCGGADYGNINIRGGFLDANKDFINPTYDVNDNITTFTFSENVVPSFISPHVSYIRTSEDTSEEPIRYFIDFKNEKIAHISIEDALAATNGIQLTAYNMSSESETPVVSVAADEEPIVLFVEKISDNPYTLQMKLLDTTGLSESKSVLYMEKSPSNEIDLSPLTSNILKEVTLSLETNSYFDSWTQYCPNSYTIMGYQNSGDSVEAYANNASASLNENILSFEWHEDAWKNAVIVFNDDISVEIPNIILNAAVENEYEGSTNSQLVKVKIISKSKSSSVYSISLELTHAFSSTLSLASTTFEGKTTVQKVNLLKLKPSNYKGATLSADGIAGLVPSASIADRNKYLKGDGTWSEIANVDTSTLLLDNYQKANSASAISSSDSVLQAIGKLEKALDGKQDTLSTITSSELSTGTDTSSKSVTAKVVHDYVTEEVASGVAGLVNSAPATLDTLNELAAALGNDANFATTVSGQIGSKLDASSANYIKSLSISGQTITYTKGDNTTDTLTTQDTIYTHPATAGNKHIPSGGSSGQFLGWSADGTAAWVNNPDTNSTTHIYAGASSTATTNASSATSNTATYIVICDDSTARNAVQIAGSNGTTVSAANGVLTIDSPALAAVATSQIDTLFA